MPDVTSRTRWHGRLVRAAVVFEHAVQVVLVTVIRLRRRHQPLIIPFLGHGNGERAWIAARVLLGRKGAGPRPIAAWDPHQVAPVVASDDRPAPRRRRDVFRASASRFLTLELPRAWVSIHTPDGMNTARANSDGYVDAVVALRGTEPGWHNIELSLPDGRASTKTPVLVVDPRTRVGLVSDVDDTILETGLTRGLAFVKATLLTDVADRAPLPGAAALYRALVSAPDESADGLGRPVFYISTSPWNLHEMLLQFLSLRGFPLGPLMLTDWGPGHGSLFRISAQDHKLTLIRRLLVEHPELDLILIGDSGQADPEIYAAVAQESPQRIRAVYIRRTAPANPRRRAEVDALAARVSALGVPMLAVADSAEIAVHAASIGLLDDAAVAAVRHALVQADDHKRSRDPARE